MSDSMTDVSPAPEASNGDLNYSDQHYFNSYDHFGIHEEMLKDDVRTTSYRNAIYQNRHMFKDKVVLDVGCGTGILSMFAARSGAKHVIGVDMSNIIHMARKIVDLNGFSNKITLLHGKMEEVELPYPKVDIIISEWMGYFLLYESMLDTVLIARDKYLVEGGLIFPDKATIYAAAIEDGDYKEEKIGFWNDVYGFDYSPFQELALADPLVDTVELRAVITDPCPIFDLDLYTITIEDLAFSREFSLKARRDDIAHAIVAWFDIEFSKCHKPIKFSTGPHAKYTHWKQTVFYLADEVLIKNGEYITGRLTSGPNSENPRNLDITITHKLETEDEKRKSEGEAHYVMK
ncbi:protein-arginine omega-N methyltransferase HMT1 [Sugiyamaella lignohabitans]|uniref:Protein-arginine omega-N methyltransferase HMT1 n=1 Tax=Sugiyamaella lignohabitans TaxID=796027 RepID=A0A161HL48_9ASCO|nr:protein-arginine omega-N methyltransferase HMT1 [Sugiyamaella lignohabitans]ANB13937.1 protein-arginine omega-N methyltransferase HMT1 [Sugiyamaella lignohabitans]